MYIYPHPPPPHPYHVFYFYVLIKQFLGGIIGFTHVILEFPESQYLAWDRVVAPCGIIMLGRYFGWFAIMDSHVVYLYRVFYADGEGSLGIGLRKWWRWHNLSINEYLGSWLDAGPGHMVETTVPASSSAIRLPLQIRLIVRSHPTWSPHVITAGCCTCALPTRWRCN